MRRSTTQLALALLLAILVGAAAPADASEIDPQDRELIIDHAYRNLTRLAAVGGERLQFRLEDFRTVEAEDFDRVRWLRLVTMPGGDMVDMAREVREYNGAVESVIYRPSWKIDGPRYVRSREGRTLRGQSVAGVLNAIAVENPDAARVTAVTSYKVTVTFQERSRTYRAAVLWLPPSSGRDATLYFMDHVTQGLEEAVRERTVTPRPRPRRLTAASTTNTCYQTHTTKSLTDAVYGYDGHWNDNTSHHSIAQVDFDCTCASDCSSTCEATFAQATCDDNAAFTIDACHKMATNIKTRNEGRADGTTTPASCAAGLGCIQKSCLYCVCGLSIEVDIVGLSVTFAASGEPDWSANQDFTWECSACAVAISDGGGLPTDPYDQDPDGGGSGGGGGTGCCWSYTTCYTDSDGVYHCTLSSCGQYGC